MYDFIVGGYLPGTNIQISLQIWLMIYDVLFGALAIIYLEYRQRLARERTIIRVTLFANELHDRLQ
jgi:hypothetical protein